MLEYKCTPKASSSNETICRTETELDKESSPSYNPYPMEAKTYEDLHLSNHQDNNKDICGKAARASTGLIHASRTNITAPRHAHIPNEREPIPGLKNQAAGAMEPAGPRWSCKKTPYNPCRAEPKSLENTRDNTQNNSHGSSVKATHNSSSWLNRLSTQFADAFGASIAAPSQFHFLGERSFEQPTKEHSLQIEALNNTLGDLNREASLTGRKRCNGFDKTRKLLAKILMERTSGLNGSTSRPHARSFENLTPGNQILYKKAADGFIKWALEFYMRNRDSYGPGTTVHDFMIVKLMNEEYGLPEDGETKEHLYGEWEYLWAEDDDGILESETPVAAELIQPSHPPSSKNRLWVWGNIIPTAEDWKWWFGELKKVPGAIWEWKPREEMWPWQRSHWNEA
ncbi:hypothetical protein EYC80_004715 [Monilinia laxa]|uniref:Uncharacterized protein n=1 Tax=Monilinia laxa TaxID=61186 RepID=A0A5N6KHL1_MONLA|nr:hypothetical protein EYC80_004715 [Monilinia laxa]